MMSDCDSVKAKLSPMSLGFALGIMKGVCLLALAWSTWLWGFGAPMVEKAALYYQGYGPSFVGGIVGGLWGLVGGFIMGAIFAWLYNCCLRCCCCKKSSDSTK